MPSNVWPLWTFRCSVVSMSNPSHNLLLPCNPLRSIPRDIYLWSCPVLSSAKALLDCIHSATFTLYNLYTPFYIQYTIYISPPPHIHTLINSFHFSARTNISSIFILPLNVYSPTDVFIHAM